MSLLILIEYIQYCEVAGNQKDDLRRVCVNLENLLEWIRNSYRAEINVVELD